MLAFAGARATAETESKRRIHPRMKRWSNGTTTHIVADFGLLSGRKRAAGAPHKLLVILHFFAVVLTVTR